jgi:hypothetical protein
MSHHHWHGGILRSATGLAAIAVTLSSIANGAQLAAIRFVVQQNDPLAVALRYAIAFACLAPLLRNLSRWPTRRDYAIILILGDLDSMPPRIDVAIRLALMDRLEPQARGRSATRTMPQQGDEPYIFHNPKERPPSA